MPHKEADLIVNLWTHTGFICWFLKTLRFRSFQRFHACHVSWEGAIISALSFFPERQDRLPPGPNRGWAQLCLACQWSRILVCSLDLLGEGVTEYQVVGGLKHLITSGASILMIQPLTSSRSAVQSLFCSSVQTKNLILEDGKTCSKLFRRQSWRLLFRRTSLLFRRE